MMGSARSVMRAAVIVAALGFSVGQAQAQDRDPAKSMATGKRIRHADRKAAAQRAKAAREAAAKEKEAAAAPKAKGAKQAKPSLETK